MDRQFAAVKAIPRQKLAAGQTQENQIKQQSPSGVYMEPATTSTARPSRQAVPDSPSHRPPS